MNEFEGRVVALMSEVVEEKLKSKLLSDDTEEMKMELEDRDGQLQQLQREEAAVQASMTGAPKACAPPGLLLPNGFNVGDGTATGARGRCC